MWMDVPLDELNPTESFGTPISLAGAETAKWKVSFSEKQLTFICQEQQRQF